MVRTALAGNAWLQAEGVMIASQGSYFNNTNVRLEFDMDLRAVHPLVRIEYHIPARLTVRVITANQPLGSVSMSSSSQATPSCRALR
jgi:hypothetical protein